MYEVVVSRIGLRSAGLERPPAPFPSGREGGRAAADPRIGGGAPGRRGDQPQEQRRWFPVAQVGSYVCGQVTVQPALPPPPPQPQVFMQLSSSK